MKLGHGNCHKSHGKVMEKSWKFVGKNVYEPCKTIDGGGGMGGRGHTPRAMHNKS